MHRWVGEALWSARRPTSTLPTGTNTGVPEVIKSAAEISKKRKEHECEGRKEGGVCANHILFSEGQFTIIREYLWKKIA